MQRAFCSSRPRTRAGEQEGKVPPRPGAAGRAGSAATSQEKVAEQLVTCHLCASVCIVH